jgi:hypothetical protein
MNRRLFGTLGVVAVLISVSCKDDPLSDFDGDPAQLVVNFNQVQIPVGDTVAVTASVWDGRATPLSIPVTFTACNAVVSAVIDTSYHPQPATSTRALLIAQNPAPSCVVVTAAGFTDTVIVEAIPSAFTGTLSTTTPVGGDTMTIVSTPEMKFDPATVSVTFGGGKTGTILRATADTIVLLVPFSTPARLTIGGIKVTSYDPPLTVSLQTAQTVTQTGEQWSGYESFATAPTIPIPAAVGDTLRLLSRFPVAGNATECAETATNFDFGSTGPCSIYRFTLAAPTTVRFSVNWDSTADIDIYSCDAADPMACFEDPGTGAGSSKPEAFTFAFPAGTHYLTVENFSGVATSNIYILITRP